VEAGRYNFKSAGASGFGHLNLEPWNSFRIWFGNNPWVVGETHVGPLLRDFRTLSDADFRAPFGIPLTLVHCTLLYIAHEMRVPPEATIDTSLVTSYQAAAFAILSQHAKWHALCSFPTGAMCRR
jgi:hypothetical protein